MIPGRRAVSDSLSEKYYREGWWRNETFLDDFLEKAAQDPERPALVSYTSGQDSPSRHTYGQLELLSRRCAAALIELGVEPGETVSVQLPNTWEFLAVAIGIMRAGAIVNTLVPIFRSRELEFILGRTKSRILIAPNLYRGFDYGSMALQLRESVPTLEHVVLLGSERADAVSFDKRFIDHRWEENPNLISDLAQRLPSADDLVAIQFTSGTTGEPKGVLHSYNTVFSGAQVIDKIYGLEPKDVCFMASTLAHQTGFCYGMVKPLSMGMKVVYQDVWDPDQMLDAVETEQIVWTVSATAFAMDMVAAQRRHSRDLSSFKYFICGGAPIPPKVVEEAADVLGTELIAVWGMTENMVVTTTRPGDTVELVSNSDGTPIEWMEIRVITEKGTYASAGEEGSLQTRGSSQALGYFHREDLYAAANPEEDWFDTGDVARLRPDGGIRIVGRTKDIVIRGGENIPVSEIESLILRHPLVDEVAIIGVPDERLGERACAVVSSSSTGLSLSDLTDFLGELGTAKQFWPEELALMSEMPRTPSGKIQKFKLREYLDSSATT